MNADIWMGSKRVVADSYIGRRSPYSDEVVSRAAICSVADVQNALTIAQNAAKVAKKVPLYQRCEWMLDVARELKNRREEFAKVLCDEVAKPISFARIEVDRAIETITLSAEVMRTMAGETINTDAMSSGRATHAYFTREAAGVVVAITPFNFPLNLVAHKLAPALVAGNAVVLKPTPEAPLTAFMFAELFIKSPYATPDALSVVYGDAEVGSALVGSHIPRVISFTGSVGVGEIITKNAGIKKISLELGGNAATFIDESADLDYAASRCAVGAFVNSGQVCISLQRIYVHGSIYDEFAAKMAEATKKLIVGSPYNEDTFLGPLINEEAAIRAMEWVESAISEGAKALLSPRRDGRIFYPCVMADVDDSMKIVCEEVFAPIVSLVKIDSLDSAIERMNNSPYGLQFSIFTDNLTNAKKLIEDSECGGVVINDIPTLRFDIQPYGGVKLSGIGREGPRFAIEEFSEIKSVVIV